jgi:predicted ester cyclase
MSRRDAVRQLGAGGFAASAAMSAARGAGAQPTSTSEGVAATARAAMTAINQTLTSGDTSGLDTLFAPDYVNHTPHRSLRSGRLYAPDLAGLKAVLTDLRAVVPDAVLVVDDVLAAGDEAAVRATFRGTLDAVAAGVPALNDLQLSVGGIAIARIAADKVVESWDYDDAAELYGPLLRQTTAPAKPQETREGMSTEKREVSGFHEVSLEGIGTLLITQSDTESLSIEAEPKVLRRIETEVQAGRLSIRPGRTIRTREPITYTLSVIDLSGIEVSGAGRVEAQQITTDDLRLVVNGAGSVTIDDLSADTLNAVASGNVEISLAGSVDQQTIELSGASRYRAAELASRVATVTAAGASQATVRVSESLDAHVSGVSRVEYIGDPTVTQEISGVGSVTKVG